MWTRFHYMDKDRLGSGDEVIDKSKDPKIDKKEKIIIKENAEKNKKGTYLDREQE